MFNRSLILKIFPNPFHLRNFSMVFIYQVLILTTKKLIFKVIIWYTQNFFTY